MAKFDICHGVHTIANIDGLSLHFDNVAVSYITLCLDAIIVSLPRMPARIEQAPDGAIYIRDLEHIRLFPQPIHKLIWQAKYLDTNKPKKGRGK